MAFYSSLRPDIAFRDTYFFWGSTGYLNNAGINIKKIYIVRICMRLKVHKIENFFGSDFEFFTIALLVLFKY